MNNRFHRIDEIRGITLISMILYHFCWDLKYIANIKMDWYTGPLGQIWQQSICICFIFISGFCFHLGKRHLKRSLEVFLCGAVITAVTLIVMPENRIIFGILTFIGSAGLIMILIDKLVKVLSKRLDSWTINTTLFVGGILLFVVFYGINYREINLLITKVTLPAYLFSGYFETYIGFTDPTFYSTDYFSLLPWIFLYIAGYGFFTTILHKSAKQPINQTGNLPNLADASVRRKVCEWLSVSTFRPLSYIGSRTLFIYMLHQPVLYIITIIVMKLS